MSRIEWDDSLSVSNDELDSQHKEFIRFYNNLHESLIRGSAEETEKAREETLNNLARYSDNHFETEEKFLRDIDFENIESHQLQHKDFKNKIDAFIRDLQTGNIILCTSLIKMLRNWIIEHIGAEDQKYAEHYRKIREL